MKTLKIGDLTLALPIVQGGMGVGVSLAGLAAAVANAGGIGVISCVALGLLSGGAGAEYLGNNLHALRHEIRKAQSMTKGILGVNVMMALSDYGAYARAAAEEGIDVIFSGAGLPMNLPELVPEGSKTKLVPIVSSGRAAAMICRRWNMRYGRLPDGVVVEGPLAGGHLGFHIEQIDDPAYALEKLVPETIAAIEPYAREDGTRIPVIAAGGIYTGADILRFEELGAAGFQMGTRFVVTEECEVSPAFKQAYLDCTRDDLTIIKSPVGLPGRAINNAFLESVAAGTKHPIRCPYRCLSTCSMGKAPYCIARALLEARQGNLDKGFAFAGANAYRTSEVVSVRDLILELTTEYNEAVAARDTVSQWAGSELLTPAMVAG